MERIKTLNMFKQIHKELEMIKDEINLSENQLSTMESFIDRYLPVQIQSHLSEVLGQVFNKGSEEREKLLNVEKAKFAEIFERMLQDDGHPDLLQTMRQMHQNIKEQGKKESKSSDTSSALADE